MGSRTVQGLGAFGYAVFIEGDAKAQTQFGSALPSMFGAKAGFDLTRRSLRSADAGVRSGIDRAVEWAGQPTHARTSFVTEGSDGATQLRNVSSDELLMRAQAETGDMVATRTLIGQGEVDGLDLVENSHAIRGEGGRFISHSEASTRASITRPGSARTLETRHSEEAFFDNHKRIQDEVARMEQARSLRAEIGAAVKTAIEVVRELMAN